MPLLVALLCVAAPSRAEESVESSKSAVEVVLVGAIGEAPAFSRRVTSWFDPERFRVAVRRVARLDPSSILAPKRDGAVYVWVLLRDATHARLYFACASGSGTGAGGQTTYLWRDLELAAGLDELGAENIAQVLHLSTVALLEGQAGNRREEVERVLSEEPAAQDGATPRTPPEPPPPPPVRSEPRTAAAPDREPKVRAELGLGYGVSLRGDEGIWHGPRIGFGVRAPSGWGLLTLAQSALPSRRERDALELEFYGALVALTGSYRHALGRGVAFDWHAGPGVEVVRYRPVRSLEPTVAAGSAAVEARPGAVAGTSGVFGRSSPRIAVSVQCVIPFEQTHYDVVVGEVRRVIGRAAPVIPSLSVEARF